AEARTQLAAQVGNHAAAIVAEQAARAEADQAEAEARTQLAAQVGNHAAAIVAEQAARAEADQAEAEARTQLAAQVGNHAAAIEENADAIVELDGKVEAQYYVLVTADGKIGGFILGTNGTTSEFSILADKFKIATADGSDTQIFTVDTDTGLVQILGSLIASDSITGDKINAKTRIQIGDSIILDGPNNAIQISDGAILLNGATGALTCLDPRNTTTGKKVVLSYGDIQFLRYNTSTGVYEEYQSVKGIASGSANSGEWVEIPGVWLEQPDILVGPKLVKSFEAANVGLDQFWHFGVKAISEITAGSGRWRAMFACELRLGSDINVIQLGNEVTSSIGSGASAAEYYSNVFTTPANAREIIVNGHVKTSDASGFTPPPDTISIVLQYKLTSASQYTNAQSIQLSFNTYKRPNHEDWPQAVKTWVLSALGLSSGTYHVRLKYSLARQADPMHHISTARLSADNMQVETLSTGNIRAGSVYWLALSQG
ncbi:MAG: DUF1983 domain-containing protein, partial [Synergistaceae bacterium]|nr:DUF1983 domain-containing protein [Synergistaceae bacterium]